MTYDDLLSRAITRASERGSIRQAALKIGISDVCLGQYVRWRETGKYPSEEVLFKIAKIAGEDEIKSHYATMAVRVRNTALSNSYEALAS